MGISWSDINKASKGGTEIMMRGLEERLSADLLQQVQIIPSRLREPLDPTKIRILWCHDTEEDPEVAHLKDGGWGKFHRIVFVSNDQMHGYIRKFDIPWSRCVVMPNAIVPIPWVRKPEGPIRLIYTSTPHRGLNVLVASFTELAKRHDDVILDVYSSFGLYGWKDRDEPYREMFDYCENHPRINYSGAVPNDEIREALQRSHVFAYPSTWVETSCLCLMEAMSADLICVHSNLGALYETAANWTVMYPYHENQDVHAGIFLNALEVAVEAARKLRDEPSSQKNYADLFYSWEARAAQWQAFLTSLLGEPRSIPDGPSEFVYRV